MNTQELLDGMVYRLGNKSKVSEQIADRLEKMPNEKVYFTGTEMVSKKQYLAIKALADQ